MASACKNGRSHSAKGGESSKGRLRSLCSTDEVSILFPLPFSGKAGRAREQKSERTDEEERETSPPKVVVEKASGGKGRGGERRFFARGIQIGSIESWGTKGGGGAELGEKEGREGLVKPSIRRSERGVGYGHSTSSSILPMYRRRGRVSRIEGVGVVLCKEEGVGGGKN